MEIRTLKYFWAIAKEESFSAAGENILFVTQPTLSRQMHDLEEELGMKLFRRTGKKTLLTYAGLRFKKRAEEIIDLVQRMSAEFESDSDEDVSGDVFIGSGETPGVRIVGIPNFPKKIFVRRMTF